MTTTLSPNRRKTRRSIACTAALAVAIGITACGSSGKTSSATPTTGAPSNAGQSSSANPLGAPKLATGSAVKIGVFNVEGGSHVSIPTIGDAAVAAADYANDYLGGLAGHRIDILRCGDKADGVSATNCANQFVTAGVSAIVTGLDAQADLLVPIVSKAGIAYFGTGVNSALETSTQGLHFMTPGILGDIAAMGIYAQQKGYHKVEILTLQNPQALSSIETLKPSYKARGIDVTETIVPQGTPDATPQVASAMANKPDAVIVVADPVTCQSLFTGLQTAGFSGRKMIIDACLNNSAIQAIGSSGLNGTAVFSAAARLAKGSESALYDAVMAKYYPKADLGGATYNGYTAMLGLIRAVNASEMTSNPTAANIQSSLQTAKSVPQPLGDGKSFDCSTSALAGSAIVKSTICSPHVFVSTMQGAKYGSEYEAIDISSIFK